MVCEVKRFGRRVLSTIWMDKAWEEISADKDLVIIRCGISVAVDGFEDDTF